MKDLHERRHSSLYHKDFVRWCDEAAQALRDGRYQDIDREQVADEVQEMGKRDRRELRSRMTVLIQHLLKWYCQPALWFKKASWQTTIREQRRQIKLLLDDSPSLHYFLASELVHLYRDARAEALEEMTRGMLAATPTEVCPYTLDEILDPAFLPKRRARLQRYTPIHR